MIGDPAIHAYLWVKSHLRGFGTYTIHHPISTINPSKYSYVHGHKVVCPQASDASIKTFQILDFNVYSARSQETVFDRGAMRTDCVGPSTVPRGKVFYSDITTSLPYSATTRPVSEHYSAYMIDEDRIIGLKVRYLSFVSYHIDANPFRLRGTVTRSSRNCMCISFKPIHLTFIYGLGVGILSKESVD